MLYFFIGTLFITANIFVKDGASITTESMFLRLFNRNSTFHDVLVQEARELIPHLTENKPLALYIHGYLENANVEGPRIISQAYLNETDHNIIVADYRQLSILPYPIVVALVDEIGKAIAGALDTIVSSDANVTNVHLIGHSLGSHVAGSAARQANSEVHRITGLDPAGPLFTNSSHRLSPSDANFVDIIHTDMGIYGIAEAIGHVDFYPNYGYRPQPGCSLFGPTLTDLDLCSHQRSYEYYMDSIINNNYVAVKCASEIDALTAECDQNDVTVMGYRTPSNVTGKYYLKTNGQLPYGQGSNGIESFISNNSTVF